MTIETCKYCGAPNNGTCAYPGENKPDCLRDIHRELDEQIAAEVRRIARHMTGSTGQGDSNG